jgi:hypothetical protein
VDEDENVSNNEADGDETDTNDTDLEDATKYEKVFKESAADENALAGNEEQFACVQVGARSHKLRCSLQYGARGIRSYLRGFGYNKKHQK